jgi:hypothetical protein
MRIDLKWTALAAAVVGSAVAAAPAARHDPHGAASRHDQLPPGVTRMTMRDRLTQCNEMLPGILDYIEGQAPRGGVDDATMRDMSLAALTDCHDLTGEMLARVQQMKRTPRHRR